MKNDKQKTITATGTPDNMIVYPAKISFDIGDEALAETKERSKDKGRYDGSYKIIWKMNERRYLLKDQEKRPPEKRVETEANFLKNENLRYLKTEFKLLKR